MEKLLEEISATIVPQLYCPLTPAVNPYAECVQLCTIEWALKFQLVQPQSKQLARLHAIRSGQLAALYFPRLAPHHLELVTDWMTWLFCCDDLCDAGQLGRDPQAWWPLAGRLLKIIKGENCTTRDEPLDNALADICLRLRHVTNEVWIARFTNSVMHYFQSTQWEAMVCIQEVTPDLSTYTKMRPYTGGVYTCFDMLGIASALDPEADCLSHAYVKQLEVMANNHMCWVNDLFSLAKELREGNRKNLVLVLQHEQQLRLPEALERVVAMCNAEMRAFLNLVALLSVEKGTEGESLQLYIDGLAACIRGNLDWHTQTGRYQVKN